jgi:hypothetical protein
MLDDWQIEKRKEGQSNRNYLAGSDGPRPKEMGNLLKGGNFMAILCHR